MAAPVLLLFESDGESSATSQSIVNQLENAGYEVVEAHNLSLAAALLFVDRRVGGVVIKDRDDGMGRCFAESAKAIRPELPLFTITSNEDALRAATDYIPAALVSNLDS